MTQRSTTNRNRHRATIARTKPNCWICGDPIDYSIRWPHPDCYVVDHKKPIIKGGDDTLANKAAAHNRCNSAKRARDVAPIIRRSGSLT